MYQQCHLVHCDLSEYNILQWRNMPYFIDVGQSVEAIHPRAQDFLFRDCHHVTRFFSSMGVAGMLSTEDLYARVSGDTISKERQMDCLQHVSMAKGKLRGEEEPQDTSRVCESMPVFSRANKELLLEGVASVDSEESAEEAPMAGDGGDGGEACEEELDSEDTESYRVDGDAELVDVEDAASNESARGAECADVEGVEDGWTLVH
jgi:RIO kinase 3